MNPAPQHPAPHTSHRIPEHILVIEDETPVRGVLMEILREVGYDAREAGNGLEALKVLESWPCDLILLDLWMPVMDGWQFRSRQLALHQLAGIPVILLSADRNLHDYARQMSATRWFQKPFDVEHLLDTVDFLVARPADGPSASA